MITYAPNRKMASFGRYRHDSNRPASETVSESTLFVVATPIGNLEDISARALRVLAEADQVLAEDTRHTRKLLRHFGIDTPLVAMHEHNEERLVPVLLRQLDHGESLALVADAGTPLVSDPGFRLVRAAAAAGVRVVPIPGPSAVLAALSGAGLPTDRFVFEGFLPAGGGARAARLEALRREPRTIVLFESGNRILASLDELAQALGADRPAVIGRELTKQFETFYRGTIAELQVQLGQGERHRRGEFVLLLGGYPGDAEADLEAATLLARVLLEHLSASQAARVAARVHGVARREVYRALEGG